MLKSAEISHEIEAEKQDVDKLLVDIREAKETLLKIQQDFHPKEFRNYTKHYDGVNYGRQNKFKAEINARQ